MYKELQISIKLLGKPIFGTHETNEVYVSLDSHWQLLP